MSISTRGQQKQYKKPDGHVVFVKRRQREKTRDWAVWFVDYPERKGNNEKERDRCPHRKSPVTVCSTEEGSIVEFQRHEAVLLSKGYRANSTESRRTNETVVSMKDFLDSL